MNRVNEIADRKEGFIPDNAIPSKHMVPLEEIIAEAFNAKVNTVKVKREYEKLVTSHTEFEILLDIPETELYRIADRKITEGILKVRAGDINIIPGYDGVYGRISIFSKQPDADIKEEEKPLNIEPEQRSLF